MSHLLLAVFLTGSTVFRLTRLVIVVRKARHTGQGKVASKPIFWIMTASYFVYLFICVKEGWTRSASFSIAVSLSGAALYVFALALREMAMRDLGRFFSPNIEIRQSHRVIRDGLYRYIRHPLLLCMATEIIGVGLVFNAYRSLVWLGLGYYFPLIVTRWLLEERALVKSLGDEYRQYQREVGAFIPKRYSHV